ncbi:hypothetical protein HK104_004116 [Borealophlyctis nickersoniae]|nr:hypothetical protein HK104_004116 [Borealophlyctis nickersoniae]
MSNTSPTFPIRVALLGAGIFAKNAHLPRILAYPSLFHLVACYSRSKASAQSVLDLVPKDHAHPPPKVYYQADDASSPDSLESLLADPTIHAVVIALPIASQPDIVRAALQAGKHVLSEKPVATTVADGRDLIRFYEQPGGPKSRGLVWHVAENWRCEPAIRYAAAQVRDLISSASVDASGVKTFDLRCYVDLTPTNRYVQTGWRTSGAVPGGFIMDGGVHWAALLRAVVGDEVESVSAFSHLWEPYLTPTDSISAIVRMKGGALGTWNISFAAAGRNLIELTTVVGQGGVDLKLGSDVKGAKRFSVSVTRPVRKETDEVSWLTDVEWFDMEGIEEEWFGFAREISGTKTLPGVTMKDGLGFKEASGDCSPHQALADVAVLEAMLNSGAAGGTLQKV